MPSAAKFPLLRRKWRKVADLLTLGDLKETAPPASPAPLSWFPSERAAWAPPEPITVSQWAAAHRVLPKQSAIPGPWSNRLAPYAVGVMDSFNDPRVERLTIMASVQSVKTESVYNMLGFAISQDPAPALVVMPTLKTLKRVNRRLRDMLFASPELSAHLTGNPDDLKLEVIHLDRMDVYFATAGSSADLQNVEARYIILDETDEYPLGPDDGSPIEMAVDRATTYWNRLIVSLSRPTVPEGHINKEYEASDRRKYWVPCPYCGVYQVLSFWQVKHRGEKRAAWPRDRRGSEYLKARRPARYECLHCQAEIDDSDKSAMLAAGKWVPEGHPIAPDGAMTPPPPTAHVGFWWSALYSPFRTFSEVAAQFFLAKDDRDKYRVFVNQWLAEPWKEIIQQKAGAEILLLRTARPPLTVPAGTLGLTAGIDNQRQGLWVSIWAWVLTESGHLDQHLIRYGFLADFTELEVWLFQDVYHSEDNVAYPVCRAGIDTGGSEGGPGEATQTEQVYDWLRRHRQGWWGAFGIKGSSRPLAGGKKMQDSLIDKMPGGKPLPGGLRLWILDTDRLKDAFWSRVATGRVHLHADTDEVFAAHLSAEVKERDRRGRETWVQLGRRDNHLLDTTIYAAAMADPECWGGVKVLPRPGAAPAAAERPRPADNPFTGRPVGSFLGGE
jgi:phage terminase large subunit GpA-like protein